MHPPTDRRTTAALECRLTPELRASAAMQAKRTADELNTTSEVSRDLMLPDTNDFPTRSAKTTKVPPVTPSVRLDLLPPERCQRALPHREPPSMPEIPVNEDRNAGRREHDVGPTPLWHGYESPCPWLRRRYDAYARKLLRRGLGARADVWGGLHLLLGRWREFSASAPNQAPVWFGGGLQILPRTVRDGRSGAIRKLRHATPSLSFQLNSTRLLAQSDGITCHGPQSAMLHEAGATCSLPNPTGLPSDP